MRTLTRRYSDDRRLLEIGVALTPPDQVENRGGQRHALIQDRHPVRSNLILGRNSRIGSESRHAQHLEIQASRSDLWQAVGLIFNCTHASFSSVLTRVRASSAASSNA